jgi:hypothetical protein
MTKKQYKILGIFAQTIIPWGGLTICMASGFKTFVVFPYLVISLGVGLFYAFTPIPSKE